jgi:hypothetical protein
MVRFSPITHIISSAQQPISYCCHVLNTTRKPGDSRSFLVASSHSPPFDQADSFVPLAEQRAKRAIMCLVAHDYLSNMPAERAIWWHDRLAHGRTHVVVNLPLVRRGVKRCMWLMVFTTKAHKKAILRNNTTNETTIVVPASGRCHDDMDQEREDCVSWGSRQARSRR